MGYVDELDVLACLCALEMVLRQKGYGEFQAGASVAAAQAVFGF